MSSDLTVVPTPDDGTRLTGELDWGESARPTILPPTEDSPTWAANPAAGHLVDVHACFAASSHRTAR